MEFLLSRKWGFWEPVFGLSQTSFSMLLSYILSKIRENKLNLCCQLTKMRTDWSECRKNGMPGFTGIPARLLAVSPTWGDRDRQQKYGEET
jgi:hypothetical protein